MKSVPVVSAILKKDNLIYLQERWKPNVSPNYSGLIEIPAGVIDAYESIHDALAREIKEETNLDIVEVLDNYQSDIESPNDCDKSFVFKPFLCQQVLKTNNGLSWIGFVFLCEVQGNVQIEKSEARNPQWVTMDKLRNMLDKKPESFFSLQLPVLKYYINFCNKL